MPPRFTYTRIPAERFRSFLFDQEWHPHTFARITGSNPVRVRKWMNGTEEAPPWVYVFIRVLEETPGAIPEARKAAAEMIRYDTKYPDRGEFPYLSGAEEDEDDDIDTTAQ